MVLVAVQYRLGIFGFLAHRGAAAEAGGSAGNYALMDQLAALRWVHDNIARIRRRSRQRHDLRRNRRDRRTCRCCSPHPPRALSSPGRSCRAGRPASAHRRAPSKPRWQSGTRPTNCSAPGARSPRFGEARSRRCSPPISSLPTPRFRRTISCGSGRRSTARFLPRSPRELLARAPPAPGVIIGTNRAEFGPPPGGVKWDVELPSTFGANAARARGFYRTDDPPPRQSRAPILDRLDVPLPSRPARRSALGEGRAGVAL